MKEAAGEANITVITIVLIGVVAAVGLLVIPRLMESTKLKTCCTNGGGVVSGKYCYIPNSTNGNLTNYCTARGCGNYILNSDTYKNDPKFKSCVMGD